jgi:hypothetical protein
MLEIGRIVRAGVIEDYVFRDVLVSALVLVVVVWVRGSSCGSVIPSVARSASTSASSVVSGPIPSGWVINVGFFLDVVSHVDLLARRDVAHTNGRLFSNDEIQ